MDAGGAVYGYDGDGRRMKKTVGAETTYYFYGASGALISEFTTTVGVTGASSTDRLLYRCSDRLGTAVLAMSANGTVIENNRTLPYGELWAAQINSANNEKFTSYERDGESGLDYAMNRYYANTNGRFVSTDKGKMSLYVPSMLNRYPYTVSDPVNATDPDGNYACGNCPPPPRPPVIWLPYHWGAENPNEPDPAAEEFEEINRRDEAKKRWLKPFENCIISEPFKADAPDAHPGIDVFPADQRGRVYGTGVTAITGGVIKRGVTSRGINWVSTWDNEAKVWVVYMHITVNAGVTASGYVNAGDTLGSTDDSGSHLNSNFANHVHIYYTEGDPMAGTRHGKDLERHLVTLGCTYKPGVTPD